MEEKKSIWCWLGLHEWYKGNFSSPVWGRYERHCLCCEKKQYSEYKSKKQYWITFALVLCLTFVSCKNKSQETINQPVVHDSVEIDWGKNTDSLCLK